MNKIHNFIGEQIIKYIFRHGGMITVQRKAGAVQVAKVYSKAAYENVIVPALNLYTHQNIKTQADRIRSFSDEELAEFIEQVSTDSMETISFGTKEYEEIWEHKETALQWLQSEVEA